jgi:hypothetical protein
MMFQLVGNVLSIDPNLIGIVNVILILLLNRILVLSLFFYKRQQAYLTTIILKAY